MLSVDIQASVCSGEIVEHKYYNMHKIETFIQPERENFMGECILKHVQVRLVAYFEAGTASQDHCNLCIADTHVATVHDQSLDYPNSGLSAVLPLDAQCTPNTARPRTVVPVWNISTKHDILSQN